MGEGLARACERTVWGMGLQAMCGGTTPRSLGVGRAAATAKRLNSFGIDAWYRDPGGSGGAAVSRARGTWARSIGGRSFPVARVSVMTTPPAPAYPTTRMPSPREIFLAQVRTPDLD